MEYRDYYATLGVPRTHHSQTSRRPSARSRALHPDVNEGVRKAEARFKELNEAYDVLCDPEKRKLYDQLGANWDVYRRGGAGGGARAPIRARPSPVPAGSRGASVRVPRGSGGPRRILRLLPDVLRRGRCLCTA